jgi:hypothetical protein
LEKVGLWEHAIEKHTLSFVPFIFSLLPGHHKVSSFALLHPSVMMLCLTLYPKAVELADYGLKPLKF